MLNVISVYNTLYHSHSEGCIVVSIVCLCLFVRMSVNSVTPETLRDVVTKFLVHDSVVERADTFKNGYIGVHGQ